MYLYKNFKTSVELQGDAGISKVFYCRIAYRRPPMIHKSEFKSKLQGLLNVFHSAIIKTYLLTCCIITKFTMEKSYPTKDTASCNFT